MSWPGVEKKTFNKSKSQPKMKVQLSSTFSGTSFHITSDAYNEENAPPMINDRKAKGCSTPKSMDFVQFDGQWENFTKEIQATPEYRCSDSLWHFMQFESDEPSENKQPKIKRSAKEELFSSTRRIRISDKDTAPLSQDRNPLQTLTNKLGVKVQQLAKKSPTLIQKNDPTPKTSNRSNKHKTFGVRDINRSTITPTISPSATEPLSDDDDDLFWDEFAFQSRIGSKSLSVRYSQRSEINNGSKVQLPSLAEISKRGLRPNGIHTNASYWSEKNRRAYMEDRFILDRIGSSFPKLKSNTKNKLDVSGLLTKFHKFRGIGHESKLQNGVPTNTDQPEPPVEPTSVFGIFDGHAGALASQFCSDHFSWYLNSQIAYPSDISDALRSTFTSLDQDFISTGNADGTTANTCIIVGGQRVICANAGDSRAIIVKKDGSFVTLSVDHKPELPGETERITKMGGKIIHSGTWRVQGKLAVSRAIGDAPVKPYVTSDPEITDYTLRPDDFFLVIASDGVWDTLSNQQVATMTISYSCYAQNKALFVDSQKMRWAAKRICERARDRGSRDNLSAIVVDLQN